MQIRTLGPWTGAEHVVTRSRVFALLEKKIDITSTIVEALIYVLSEYHVKIGLSVD